MRTVEKMGVDVDEEVNWSESAEMFFASGDFSSMRACGREALELNKDSAEAWAIVAEASVYLQEFDVASEALDNLWGLASQKTVRHANLRGLFATAAYYGAQFQLDKAMAAYEQLFVRYNTAENIGDHIQDFINKTIRMNPVLVRDCKRDAEGQPEQIAKQG